MPRREKKYHYLYKTTNLINGKFYFGIHSTENLKDGYIGSGTYLWHSINKHGRENFKIEFLEFFDDRKKLLEREEKLVNEELLKDPMCMNLRKGGTGGFTKENSLKGTLAMNKKMWQDPEYRKRHVERKSKTMHDLWKNGKVKHVDWTGKNHSIESKNRMSEKAKERIGEKNSQFGTCWVYNDKESKKIKKEELNFHLSNGWIKGRKMQI
jgi:hypothetical protein